MRILIISDVHANIEALQALHERPSLREWVGILLVGAGVLILGFKR
jgi:uncharacterized membrane protein